MKIQRNVLADFLKLIEDLLQKIIFPGPALVLQPESNNRTDVQMPRPIPDAAF
jgi:hypothetical protein